MKTGLPTLFRTAAPRGFDYRPRYYDEQRERKRELEQLVAEARSGNVDNDRRLERMRQQLGHKWSGKRNHSRGRSSGQSVRFLFIVGVLGGLIWLFLNWG